MGIVCSQNWFAKWALLSIAMLHMLGVSMAADVDYESVVKPLLKQRCVSCHGSLKQEAELRLDAGALIPRQAHGEILRRVSAHDSSERMPPEGPKLAPDQIDRLRRWIDSGAPYPANEIIPKKPSDHWAFQPVARPPIPSSPHGHPIDAFLFGEGSLPAPASPGVLLRRVYLDLIGLPPTLAEQDALEEHKDFESIVDDLLSRPAHGERWARHWLDVVRYADTNGYERDAEKPMVWQYRDYVIKSINSDKPFDRFLMEQIAGDELPDASLESTIATGFLRLGHWDDEPADPKTDRYDQLDDIVSTTSQAFLGLTVGCARCHDHKFEPLSTRDYYSLVAVFNPLTRPSKGRKELTLTVDQTEVYGWQESSSQVPETFVLLRGSPTNQGERVEPAVPAILVAQQPPFPPPNARTTQRRLGLAAWLADRQNPLTARVIVNRVWQQHFGEGLVTTANDFGLMGAPPSHPELLDWLAHWFMHDAGWSLKKLHRLMLTSGAWQTPRKPHATITRRRLEVEAIRDSMLFVSGKWNATLYGPAFRPSIPLAAIEANTDKEKVWKPSEEPEASRRSIYAFIKRGLIVPMFETLDLPDTASSCQKRQVTTVAPQALSLFNSEFTQAQAQAFAERVQREAGDRVERQIELAWRLALCRRPTSVERDLAEEFLANESLPQLCRVILNLNEFVYPE